MNANFEKELLVTQIKVLLDSLSDMGKPVEISPDSDEFHQLSVQDLKRVYGLLQSTLRSIPR